MPSAHAWQERRELRRAERRRRRGGHGRGPVGLQRVVRAVTDTWRVARARLGREIRGNKPLVLVLAGALALAVVVVSGPAQSYLDAEARVEALRGKADALETENARLQQRTDDLNDPTSIELLAREQQGFIRPGEVPYTLVPPEVDRPQITAPRGSIGQVDADAWYQRAWQQVRDFFA